MIDTEEGNALARAPVWRHMLAMVYDLFLIIPLLMLTSALLVAIHGPVEIGAGLAAMGVSLRSDDRVLRHVLAPKRSNAWNAGMASQASI